MKLTRKNRICKKNAAVVLLAFTLAISSSSHNGVTSAFRMPSTGPLNRYTVGQCAAQSSLTALFAINGSDCVDSEKLTIELLTDENRDVLLRPAVDPSRPVLVDAFAPWCGPCKLLDKVLKKAQPRYLGKVDFCRWNVNDAENTAQIKTHFIEMGFTLNKLPSLIIYRDGKPVAVRPGFANEFQLDDWLETTLPDVLERTFDENGMKIEPVPVGLVNGNGPLEETSKEVKTEVVAKESTSEVTKAAGVIRNVFSPLDFKARIMTERLRVTQRTDTQTTEVEMRTEEIELVDEDEIPTECTDEEKCWELVEETIGWQGRTVIPANSGILLPKRDKVGV